MCILIGQQLCFHSAMKHENNGSDMDGCLHVLSIYSFMKERKQCKCASYTVFLYVKLENNNFNKK